MRQEENRLTKFKRIILDNRQERKRRQQLQHYHESMERCFPTFGTVLLTVCFYYIIVWAIISRF